MSDSLTPAEDVFLANMLITLKGEIEIACLYTNWRGETAERHLRPIEFWYGTTEYHTEPCLLLKAFDMDKQAVRDFAVADFGTNTLRKITRGAA